MQIYLAATEVLRRFKVSTQLMCFELLHYITSLSIRPFPECQEIIYRVKEAKSRRDWQPFSTPPLRTLLIPIHQSSKCALLYFTTEYNMLSPPWYFVLAEALSPVFSKPAVVLSIPRLNALLVQSRKKSLLCIH